MTQAGLAPITIPSTRRPACSPPSPIAACGLALLTILGATTVDAQSTRVPARDVLLPLARTASADSVIVRYRSLQRDSSARYDVGEGQLNAVGYAYLGAGRARDAVRLLDFARHEFPRSPNAQDSYAEASLVLGDSAAAAEAYQRVIALVPADSTRSAAVKGRLERAARDFLLDFGARAAFGALPGVYELPDRSRIVVGRVDRNMFDRRSIPLAILELSSGSFGVMHPVGDRSFEWRRGVFDEGTPLAKVVVDTAPGTSTPRLCFRGGESTRCATRLSAVRKEPVTFENGDVTLAGTVTLPTGRAPHPGVVLVHGSGAGGRFYLIHDLLATALASEGIAVMSYDKRGYGGSRGPSWSDASLDELASDASAALRYMVGRPDVADERVGLTGRSQGGWIAPMVAATGAPVAFVTAIGGASVSVWEQELQRVEYRLRAAGFAADSIAEAVAAMRLMFRVADTGVGFDSLAAAADRARSASWGRVASVRSDARDLQAWRRMRYDPSSTLERLRAPVLLQFGALDALVPPDRNVTRWRELLVRAGNRDITVKLYENADHAIFSMTPRGLERGLSPDGGCLVIDALDDLIDWIRPRVGLTSQRRPFKTEACTAA